MSSDTTSHSNDACKQVYKTIAVDPVGKKILSKIEEDLVLHAISTRIPGLSSYHATQALGKSAYNNLVSKDYVAAANDYGALLFG